ncbi:MAG: hypothetical protein H0W33_00985 [Gammaproteobacteria bacterium]|nr:hypothetical protein [Gammaproteobacteria bacterium]
MAERLAQAERSTQALEIDTRVVVDGMDDRVWRAYGTAPSAAFVINQHGLIALTQAWVNPDEIRDVLLELLE